MQRIRFRLILVLACIYCLSASTFAFPNSGAAADIAEAIFRWHIQQHASIHRRFNAYYLAVGPEMEAPGPQFMKRFVGYTPVVKQFIRGKYDEERMSWGGGMILVVRSIRWKSKNKVVVYGYTDDGTEEGVNWIYEMERKGKKWVVGDVANYG